EYWFKVAVYDKAGNYNETEMRKQTLSNKTIYFIPPTEENNTYRSRNWIHVKVAIPISEQNVTFYLYNKTSLLNETTFNAGEYCPGHPGAYCTNFSNLWDDEYWFNVTTYDIAGNCYSTETRKHTLDTTPPTEPSLIAPPDAIQSYDMSPLLNWTKVVEKNFANYTVEVDNSYTFESPNYVYVIYDINQSYYQVTGVWSRGIWYWRVTACDLAGNCNGTDYWSYSLIGTGPGINESSPHGYVNNPGVNLTVVTNRNATCKYDLTDREFGNMQYIFNTTAGVIHSTSSNAHEGLNQYYVRCADDINGTNTMEYSIVISFVLDTMKPTFLSINPENGSRVSNKAVQFSTSDFTSGVNVSQINVSINGNSSTSFNTSFCIDNGLGGYDCSYIEDNILEGGNNITVRIEDKARNSEFRYILFIYDETSPVEDGIVVNNHNVYDSKNVTLDINVPDDTGECRYISDDEGGNETHYDEMSHQMVRFNATRFLASVTGKTGLNTYHIKCRDIAGNKDPISTEIRFNITLREGGAPSIVIGGVEEDYTRGSVVTIFATLTDQNGNPVDPSYCNVTITHWNGSILVYDLQDTQMIKEHKGFYYYNFHIPVDADLGSYGILVEADPSGVNTHAVSGFHVVWSAICGNSICEATETCENCPADCGSCPMGAVCGNGICEATETCENCPADCGSCPMGAVCGNGICEATETCENCPADCGECPTVGGVRVPGMEDIRETLTSVENKTDEIKAIAERIWERFRRTDPSVIRDERIASYKLSRKSSIVIQYNITVPVKEGYSAGEYLPLRWKFWFVNDRNVCIDQGGGGEVEPQCKPLIAETIGCANDTIPIEIRIRPSLKRGNYSLVREFEVDPDEVWINYGREIIARIVVTEDNLHPRVEVGKVTLKAQTGTGERPAITGMVIKDRGGKYILMGLIPLLFLVSITLIIFIYHIITKKEKKERKWYER
ncbi:MAG: hypothetical protein B6U86_00160, partial [Candidatus Altiarchaeales archaeon ex4484_43]